MAGTSSNYRRSEDIRSRRTKTSTKAAQQQARVSTSIRKPGAKHERKPVQHMAPPVMVRETSTGFPVREHVRPGKTRRRYDLAIGANGAEMRLPAMPMVRVGWRLVSFVLAAGLVFLLYFAWTSPTFKVQAAEIYGLKRLNSQDVNSILAISDSTIFTLDKAAVKQKLLTNFPEFSAADVQVGLPDTVVITVTERIPLIAWQQEDRTRLVDSEGVAFPARPGQPLPALVVTASGVLPGQAVDPLNSHISASQTITATQSLSQASQFLSKEMVAAIQALAAQTPENTPLVFDSEHGFGWQDPRGWVVYFGDAKDMEVKLKVYEAIRHQIKAQAIKPVLISVEYVHAPYYRLK